MSSLSAKLEWNNKMSFTATSEQHKVRIDATPEHGGDNSGPSPKQLVLHAMMSCTAMDVVSMLQKMRQEISSFNMAITAEKNLHYPIYFKSAHMQYLIEGNITADKAIKAVDSSLTKYCGVNYMIAKATTITFEIILNKIKIHQGVAKFDEPAAD